MNIVEDFKESWPEVKKWLTKDNGSFNSKAAVKSWIFNRFPEFGKTYNEKYLAYEFRGILYCLWNNIEEIPKCPVCGKPLPLRTFAKGFCKTCSKECQGKYFSDNTEAATKISNTLKSKHTSKLLCLHNNDYFRLNQNDILIKDYCEHGDVIVSNRVAYAIQKIGHSTICKKCNQQIFENYIPTEEEIYDFEYKVFPKLYKKKSFAFKWDWWITYYPKELKILITYFEKYIRKYTSETPLSELYYVILHHLREPQLCCIDNCSNLCVFHPSTRHYTKFCHKHGIGYSASGLELDMINFIKTLDIPYKEHDRSILKGHEIDIYFPNNNIGIEFNGVFWHSTASKDRLFHVNKKANAKYENVDLYFIWEDDWNNKQEICKSLIKSKLGLYDKRLYARVCKIREVSYKESSEFLNTSHLQGDCVSKIRLGLYYDDKLVSLMTFGQSRFEKGNWEIIRFCSKLGYQIIGGASKVFKHFLRNYSNGQNVISYAHCDISNGKIYEILGMHLVNTTENWTWLYKGQRLHRLNKIRKEGLNLDKCYSSGVMKYSLY